jgi:hypothetical protein
MPGKLKKWIVEFIVLAALLAAAAKVVIAEWSSLKDFYETTQIG